MGFVRKHGWPVSLLLVGLGFAAWANPPILRAVFEGLGQAFHGLVVLVDKISQALPNGGAQ